jgi:hypothetical protein
LTGAVVVNAWILVINSFLLTYFGATMQTWFTGKLIDDAVLGLNLVNSVLGLWFAGLWLKGFLGYTATSSKPSSKKSK